jgi:hypothetical protein
MQACRSYTPSTHVIPDAAVLSQHATCLVPSLLVLQGLRSVLPSFAPFTTSLLAQCLRHTAGCDVANFPPSSVTDCYNACAANANCQFFVLGGGRCWWVQQVLTSTQSSPGSYVKPIGAVSGSVHANPDGVRLSVVPYPQLLGCGHGDRMYEDRLSTQWMPSMLLDPTPLPCEQSPCVHLQWM